MSPKKHLIIL